MWSAISKFFGKTNSNLKPGTNFPNDFKMDRGDDRRRFSVQDTDPQDTYDTRQAKQRASIKWLLSKAFNNKVPENLKEPFYRDHEDQEHLKPQIVHTLANAELYCLALANIYSDPNYHNLNHWGIIQALARKGVYVVEPTDAQLTETVLIQTTPIKMTAHMAVIEAMMILYAKEVVTPDRVVAAIERFCSSRSSSPEHLPVDHEDSLTLWVNNACSALRQRINEEIDHIENRGEGDRLNAPDIIPIKDLKVLSNGVNLAALVSFYCPEELPWTDIIVSNVPTISNSVHNLSLVYNFCNRCLASSVFHMMPEDVTYMQESMKQNLVVFLADLFNVLEIHPVKCVRYPGTDKTASLKEVYPRNSQGVAHKRSFPQSISAIPDLRSNLGAHSSNFTVSKSTPSIQTSLPIKKSHSLQAADCYSRSISDSGDREERYHNSEEQFPVHKGRAVPTLSSVAAYAEEPLLPARLRPAKEKQNQDSKAEERGEPPAAGRPSNWEEQRRTSYAGRRSRRNSISDDSQLTLENFGGSQENLQFLGRNPDKEPAVHVGRKLPSENGVPVRTSAQEARSSGVELIFNDDLHTSEKHDEEKPEVLNTLSLKQVLHSRDSEHSTADISRDFEEKIATSFAEISKNKSELPKGIHIVYMQQDREQDSPNEMFSPKSSFLNKKMSDERKTTFAALPNNTTTWQQQSSCMQQQQAELNSILDDSGGTNNHVMASQLHNIRMKLEEKRRRIESEKRRMEVVMNKQRQKVGKAAFLQAVTKGKGTYAKSPESDTGKDSNGDIVVENVTKPQRPFSLQEINEDISSVEQKWLDNTVPFIEERKTPDIENMDLEQYQQSIAQMNSSLSEIQTDIQRLASQQNQIQEQVHGYNGSSPNMNYHQSLRQPQAADSQGQFYLHEQGHRRTWAQPSPPQHDYYQPRDINPDWSEMQDVRPQLAAYNHQPQAGFMLHDNKPSGVYLTNSYGGGDARYYNGDHNGSHRSLNVNHSGYQTTVPQHTSFQLHSDTLHHISPTPPSSTSPQHRTSIQRISQLMGEPIDKPRVHPQVESPDKGRFIGVTHAAIPTPSVDDMEPQSISFIGDPEDKLVQSIKGLQITSGSRTYRIPSPTRPSLSRNSFHQQDRSDTSFTIPSSTVHNEVDNSSEDTTEKGFYISFDNNTTPKRPKPPLRVKRSSPKKEQIPSQMREIPVPKNEPTSHGLPISPRETEVVEPSWASSDRKVSVGNTPSGVGLVIGTELQNPDPNTLDEMERRKERIMLLSLQRRQQQEEQKQLKEQEAQRRKEMEKLKQEERERKKEEERLRRTAILEQYKLKKAIEEAEREGKLIPDKAEMAGSKNTLKMRNKTSTTTRPRPKTIHVDSGSVDLPDGILSPSSRSKKGSTSNLTEPVFNTQMRRDFYRGSQDSLADRMDDRRGIGTSYFRESPDDGRGASPCRSSNQLGRRGSYKTSRDTSEPGRNRSRLKYPTYQGNFRGRKSNSLMNLSGSSTDQDSFAYRYTDNDSGLGRATPPRRAPSPGMSSYRHLPSPSGPGSLPPGLMTKRRVFDDGASDISSTPSSMMEYTGPRLYKQPATKSNRGIMLNAVEYCVFPGAVNKEAKQRVREEIARSESKHFLILFRDAGCQFRALYSYCPEREEVTKLYGTGPKQVNDRMFDKFFKYNSGGKCFSQVHTKHLTVTIDAFTIHNSLWQGKKVSLPNKKTWHLSYSFYSNYGGACIIPRR